jgi:hypothetical protein
MGSHEPINIHLLDSSASQPWLDKRGIPLSDDLLKIRSAFWDEKTWENYLNWYEASQSEPQIDPLTLAQIAEGQLSLIDPELVG